MNFDEAFARLLKHEGGTSNHAADPAGLTRFGISKRSYPYLDIASLTEYDAGQIYKRDFWLRCRCDELPPELRMHVFDASVNSGAVQAAKWLQRAVDVSDDGVIGPVTLAACKALPGAVIAARYSGQRLDFMTRLKTWPSFSAGWARRIASNLMEA